MYTNNTLTIVSIFLVRAPAPGQKHRNVYVWNVMKGNILYRLPGHTGSVNDVDFHPGEPISASPSLYSFAGFIFGSLFLATKLVLKLQFGSVSPTFLLQSRACIGGAPAHSDLCLLLMVLTTHIALCVCVCVSGVTR